MPAAIALTTSGAVLSWQVLQVKAPQESTEPWDYFKVVQKIPGEDAFTRLADSKCPLVRK